MFMTINKSQRKRILITLIVGVAAIVIILLGWSEYSYNRTLNKHFKQINTAISSIHLDQLGRVVISKETGGNDPLFNSNPAYVTDVVIVRGDTMTVQSQFYSAMQSAGFQNTGVTSGGCLQGLPCTYSRSGYVANVVIYPAGYTIIAGDERQPILTMTVPNGSTGILVMMGFN